MRGQILCRLACHASGFVVRCSFSITWFLSRGRGWVFGLYLVLGSLFSIYVPWSGTCTWHAMDLVGMVFEL